MARIVLYLLILVVLTVGVLCADNDTTPSPATTPKTPSPVTTPKTPSETDKPNKLMEDVIKAATDIPKGFAATCKDASKVFFDLFSFGSK